MSRYGTSLAFFQMILASYLVMTDVLEPPWIWSTSKVDAQNNVVSFGPMVTLLSLVLSAITSFKGENSLVLSYRDLTQLADS